MTETTGFPPSGRFFGQKVWIFPWVLVAKPAGSWDSRFPKFHNFLCNTMQSDPTLLLENRENSPGLTKKPRSCVLGYLQSLEWLLGTLAGLPNQRVPTQRHVWSIVAPCGSWGSGDQTFPYFLEFKAWGLLWVFILMGIWVHVSHNWRP